MTNIEKIEKIKEQMLTCESDSLAFYFINPNFDMAIIGLTTDNRIIYSYPLMVQSLM